jgi:hypothetical protein
MPEDSTKILQTLSDIGSNTATSLSHDAESDRLTFYLCSNSFHEASLNNASRLLDFIKKSLSIASTGGTLSDLEDKYLSLVSDVCFNHAFGLKTVIEIVESWNAWRSDTGLPKEHSFQIMKMKQKLDHTHSIDTLKHCLEQTFRPLEITEGHPRQLRLLWRCCCALLKSNFFVDVFHDERWMDGFEDDIWFLRRVYRRIWRLYSYGRGADLLLYKGHTTSSLHDAVWVSSYYRVLGSSRFSQFSPYVSRSNHFRTGRLGC